MGAVAEGMRRCRSHSKWRTEEVKYVSNQVVESVATGFYNCLVGSESMQQQPVQPAQDNYAP